MSISVAQAKSALSTLGTARAANRPGAWAQAIAWVSEVYANNGGLKPAITAQITALYTPSKKGNTIPKVGTPERAVLNALQYVLDTAPAIGARPDKGGTMDERTALATAYAQQVRDLFTTGFVMMGLYTKGLAALKKAAKEATEEAPAGTPVTEEAPARALSVPAMLDRLATELTDTEQAREAIEAVPSLKAVALSWVTQARKDDALALANAKASAAALFAELEEARATITGLREVMAAEGYTVEMV